MALSDDLRERVIGAVLDGGMSRNAAAKRFRCEHRQRGALGGALPGQGRDLAVTVPNTRRSYFSVRIQQLRKD
jgi:transposase